MANEHPDRPFLLDGDYPPRTPEAQVIPQLKRESKERIAEQHANVQFEMDRYERERLEQEHQSGKLGGYCGEPTPRSPGEYERQMEEDADFRRMKGGLPDAPDEEMPMVAVMGGFPAKLG